MKRTGPSNVHLQNLIKELKTLSIKENVSIWKRVATDLESSTRSRRVVNIARINKYAKDGEVVVVPGKVLGTGIIERKLTVAAYSFSKKAQDLIEGSQGKAVDILKLAKENPKGKNIRIFG